VCVCACERVIKYLNAEFECDIYFVNEMETQLREKPLRGSQTQEFHYSENKAGNKIVTLVYLMQLSYLTLRHVT
jgi:hypothetical protein